MNPTDLVDELGAIWSPDIDDYSTGQTTAIRCALCQHAPCECPTFGTPEHFALIALRHGKEAKS